MSHRAIIRLDGVDRLGATGRLPASARLGCSTGWQAARGTRKFSSIQTPTANRGAPPLWCRAFSNPRARSKRNIGAERTERGDLKSGEIRGFHASGGQWEDGSEPIEDKG